MSESPVLNIAIDQGADFNAQIYWTDAGNNPFTVLHPMRMDIKSDTGQVVHSLSSGLPEDEGESGILYNSDSGLIQLNIPAAATSLFAAGIYAYDLFVTYSDEAASRTAQKRLIRGNIYVYGRVTQSV